MTFRHHLGKIIKFVATGGQILRLKCMKYYFGWGSAPDPAGENTALAQNPYSWKGPAYWPTSKGDGSEGREKKGKD